MATVYRARDLKHERTVAIKVLRPDLAEAIGADRFLREIRTTANLSHPHILPLFDSGEANGLLFYVMPFVRGESLKDRLDREGQLPVEDAVQIAREVAGALAYAHREGVIHRDIKPANILLEEGHALLADFGIAQARAGAEETQLTQGGMSLGTPSYMSPEQVSGAKELDGRADQYALGCVLYEMLAGHPPFSGADIQAVMRQHLAVDAPSVTQSRPAAPKDLAKALHRSLAKSPADRFRTMSELEAALAGATLPLLARIPMGRARGVVYAAAVVLVVGVLALAVVPRIGVEPPPVDSAPELVPNKVVVLPFENLTGDPELESLGISAADIVSQAVQQIEQVEPVSFSIARQLTGEVAQQGASEMARAVARATGAGLAVSGAVYAVADSVQFRVEVVDVNTGTPFQTVEEVGRREDPREAMGRLGERVASTMGFKLSPYWAGDRPLIFPLPIPPLMAGYRHHLDGFLDFDRRHLVSHLDHQLAAFEADSTFLDAASYAAYAILHIFRGSSLGDSLAALGDSLVQLAENRRDELTRRGQYNLDLLYAHLEGDRHGVFRVHKEMGRTAPGTYAAIFYANAAINQVNRPGEAIEALQGYDPYHPDEEWRRVEARGYWMYLCRAYHLLGEHEKELEVAREARAQMWDNPESLKLEAGALVGLGRLDEVFAILDEAPALFEDPTEIANEVGQELRAHGFPEAALEAFGRAIQWRRERPPPEGESQAGHLRSLAGLLAWAGEWEEAYAIRKVLDAEALEVMRTPGAPSFAVLDLLPSSLAVSAVHAGDTAIALEIDAKIAAAEWPEQDWDNLTARARIAAALGRPDQAMVFLRQAVSRGRPYYFWMHRSWPDLQDRQDFQDLIRPKG